jgi:hypothetical protein
MRKKTKRLTIKQIRAMAEGAVAKERGKSIKLTDKEVKTLIQGIVPYILSGGRKNLSLIDLPDSSGSLERFPIIKGSEAYRIIKKRKGNKIEELHCFVGHNFNKKKIENLRPVLNGVLKHLKVIPYYADEVLTDKTIREKVFAEIRKTDFAIFEITKLKPNVAIEIGATLIINKTTTFLIKKGEAVPEELKSLDKIFYNDYIDLRDQLLYKLPGLLEKKGLFN